MSSYLIYEALALLKQEKPVDAMLKIEEFLMHEENTTRNYIRDSIAQLLSERHGVDPGDITLDFGKMTQEEYERWATQIDKYAYDPDTWRASAEIAIEAMEAAEAFTYEVQHETE